MTFSWTNKVLAVLVVVILALALMSDVDTTEPNIEILPDMKYTPAYHAFSVNPNFENGRTLQEPVAGTIARGQTPLHYQATQEDAIRAGEELENPTSGLNEQPGLNEQLRRESASRGETTFQTFCVPCHGVSGKGDGLVSQYGFQPPPSLLTGNSVKMKDGQLLHILTYGQANMPNFKAQLNHNRRWDVINHIRSLQRSDAQDAQAAPPPTEEKPAPEQE